MISRTSLTTRGTIEGSLPLAQAGVPGLPGAPRKLLWAELLARFGFEALIVDRLRCRIRGAHLARDLFAQRHARDEVWRAILGRGLPRPGRAVPAGAGGLRRDTGESYTGDQSISSGIGGVIAFHFADVFDAVIVAHQQRQAVDQP